MTRLRTVIDPRHAQGADVANVLRDLADRAERGEIIGIAIAVWTHRKAEEFYKAGIFRKSLHLAYYVVCKMLDALLYPEEETD